MAHSGIFSRANATVVSSKPSGKKLYPNQDRGGYVAYPIESVAAESFFPAFQTQMGAFVNSLHEHCVASYLTGGTTFSAITVLPDSACLSYVGDSPVYMAVRPRGDAGPSWEVTMLNKDRLHEPGADSREVVTGRPIHLARTEPGHKLYLAGFNADGSELRLAMTRSIGDHPFANSGHSHELAHISVEIPADNDVLFIAASDGVSDAPLSELDIAGILNSAPNDSCESLSQKIVQRAFDIWRQGMVEAMRAYVRYLRRIIENYPEIYFDAEEMLPSLYSDVLTEASSSRLARILNEIDDKYPALLPRGVLDSLKKNWSSDDITAVCIRSEPNVVKMAYVCDGHGAEYGAHVAEYCRGQVEAQVPVLLRNIISIPEAGSEASADAGSVTTTSELNLSDLASPAPAPSSLSLAPLPSAAVPEQEVAHLVPMVGLGAPAVAAPVVLTSTVPPVVQNLERAGVISAVLALGALAVVAAVASVGIASGVAALAIVSAPVFIAVAALATISTLATWTCFALSDYYATRQAVAKKGPVLAQEATPLLGHSRSLNGDYGACAPQN